MQAGRRSAVRARGGQMPDHGSGRHRRTDFHGRDNRLIGRTPRPGGDCDHTAARKGSGVRDRAGGGREYWLTGGAGQVDAAMAGEPWFGGEFEAVDDLGPGLERPAGGVGGGEGEDEG
jgi:hypothetical protein